MEILERAEELKTELDNLRPLDAEAEARIMQKFRLDWNYHSNNLEGNSLTYGETKALILFGITAQGKPLKDHFEITGHNEAINWILEIVKGETVLTEAFIRQLHTLLLKESSYKEAQTANGKPPRRKIEVGKYKTLPNHVVTVTGETFYFATPEETPAKMHDLIEWFRNEKKKPDVSPIILAALFHYRFIRIHPFDDGNGRVARILMNFILMEFGYPPVIIKTEDKENYYAVLRLADAGELEPFVEYITENLTRSLEIMIRGAKGENIEEPDDLDKELALLEQRISKSFVKTSVKKSEKYLLDIFDNSVIPLAQRLETVFSKFDRFYNNKRFECWIDNGDSWQYNDTLYNLSIKTAREKIERQTTVLHLVYLFDGLNLRNLETLKKKYSNSVELEIEFQSDIYFVFRMTKYSVHNENGLTTHEKSYLESLSIKEIEEIVKDEATRHKQFIEENIIKYENLLN